MTDATTPGLLERLDEGPVLCAEGYLFELERRGYLQAGAFVPEVVLEHPEKVTELHREFVHAGSDVVEAFTYYAHREKLRVIGKEHLLERINRQALELARHVARETGTLLAGNVCNTNIWTGERSRDEVRAMFEEQVGWAVDAGVDFIIGETFSWAGEAMAATEVIKAAGLPAVVTFTPHRDPDTRDGMSVGDACRALEESGADVVGLNCARGPATMMPLLEEVRAAVSVHVAALPVPYRTHADEPSMQSLRDPLAGAPDHRAFPSGLDPFTCTREETAHFAADALALGARYLGLCCGAAPHHVRAMAEALGRAPEASRYSADMSRHAYFGNGARAEYQGYIERL
jgi:methionine synthase I (cobalamin-dependent)